MKNKTITLVGLLLLVLSQILLSFGYDFLMSQRPIDFAHWAMLLSAVLLFSLWFSLPSNPTKKLGLSMMSLGIAGVAGMCMIDFLLWSMNDNQEAKNILFEYISNTPSIQLPFLVIGPALFYGGICVATYGLFSKYKWQVVLLNIGGMMIGLGHMVFQNRVIPAIGAIFLMVGLSTIVLKQK